MRLRMTAVAVMGLALGLAACGPQPQVQHDAGEAESVAPAPPAPITQLTIDGGVVRPATVGATTAGYFTLRSPGADRLLAASSPLAERIELHEHVKDAEGLMGMRQVEGGVPLPANEAVVFQPGGLHLMFFNVQEALADGREVPVTLTFETAGTVETNLIVGNPGVPGAEGAAMAGPAAEHAGAH